MAKLPDATSLGDPKFAPARGFVNIETPNTAQGFAAFGRGLADLGAGAQSYANDLENKLTEEEAFGINLRLADAQVSFAEATKGLDAGSGDFAQKRSQIWKDTFGPILSNIKHSKNRMKFGEWGVNSAKSVEIKSLEMAQSAKIEATKLSIDEAMIKQSQMVANGIISAEEASANVSALIASAPGLSANDRKNYTVNKLSAFNENLVNTMVFSMANSYGYPGSSGVEGDQAEGDQAEGDQAEGDGGTIPRRGQSEEAAVNALMSNPLFKSLDAKAQMQAVNALRSQWNARWDEQEKLDRLAKTQEITDDLAVKYSAPGDRDQAYAELRDRIKDPIALADGMSLLDQSFKRFDSLDADEQVKIKQDTTNKVIELRDAGNTPGALAAASNPAIKDPAVREALRELALNGPANVDNAQVEGDLWTLAYKNPAEFANVDLSDPKYRTSLSQPTIEKFEKRQAELKKPGDLSSIQSIGDIIGARFKELGIDTSAKASPADATFARTINTSIGRRLEALERRLGRKATFSEITDLTDSVFLTFEQPGTFYGTNTTTLEDVFDKLRKQEESEGFPAGFLYEKAVDNILSYEHEPTPENILLWLNGYRDRKQQQGANQ